MSDTCLFQINGTYRRCGRPAQYTEGVGVMCADHTELVRLRQASAARGQQQAQLTTLTTALEEVQSDLTIYVKACGPLPSLAVEGLHATISQIRAALAQVKGT